MDIMLTGEDHRPISRTVWLKVPPFGTVVQTEQPNYLAEVGKEKKQPLQPAAWRTVECLCNPRSGTVPFLTSYWFNAISMVTEKIV
eukprot:1158434-Pelagomonas_calceolata.AAC.1